jgi:hypothetical protein
MDPKPPKMSENKVVTNQITGELAFQHGRRYGAKVAHRMGAAIRPVSAK